VIVAKINIYRNMLIEKIGYVTIIFINHMQIYVTFFSVCP